MKIGEITISGWLSNKIYWVCYKKDKSKGFRDYEIAKLASLIVELYGDKNE